MLIGDVQFIAGKSDVVPGVLAMLKRESVETTANPDLYVRHFGNFGIDEARDLSAKAAMRALGGGKRYFVVAVDAITIEAQNALLKTLEEPPAGAVFIFLHPAPQTLLPTVRSRAQILQLPNNEEIEQGPALLDPKTFLGATPAKRLDMLKPILEKGDDDKRDFGAIIAFLAELEAELSKSKKAESLHALYRARRYLGDRGALVKPLLEQVALLV